LIFTCAGFNAQRATLLIQGYEQLHEAKLLLPYLSQLQSSQASSSSRRASALGEQLVTSIFESGHKYGPLQRAVAGRMLQLAMAMDFPVASMLKLLVVS
jgi:hypothetical protein